MSLELARQLAALDATAQAELIRSGAISAGEAVEASIAACEALDPELNAVIHPAFDEAREAASERTGPLAGVPMLTKDLICREAGRPFHEGNRFLKEIGHVSPSDQLLAERFRAAGLVSIGRTNTSEFGLRPVCEPDAFGPTCNPWNPARSTGGSSGGSAAAVAAGIVAVAHASDVGGSIRNPAGNCGLVGLKPSRGRSDSGPDFGDALGGLGEELVVTRSVRDTALLLRELCGPAPGQWQGQWPLADPVDAAAAADPGRLRAGWMTSHPAFEVDPRIADFVADVTRLLAELGHDVSDDAPAAMDEDISGFLFPHYVVGASWIVDHHWSRVLGQPIPEDGIEAGTAMLCAIGRTITAGKMLEFRELAQSWTRRLSQWWVDHDVLVTPVLPMIAPELGTRDPINDAEFLAFLGPFNVSGHPAMSLPLGMVDGVPVGVQFVATHGREDVLVALGAQLEQARPWAGRRPDVHVDHR